MKNIDIVSPFNICYFLWLSTNKWSPKDVFLSRNIINRITEIKCKQLLDYRIQSYILSLICMICKWANCFFEIHACCVLKNRPNRLIESLWFMVKITFFRIDVSRDWYHISNWVDFNENNVTEFSSYSKLTPIGIDELSLSCLQTKDCLTSASSFDSELCVQLLLSPHVFLQMHVFNRNNSYWFWLAASQDPSYLKFMQTFVSQESWYTGQLMAGFKSNFDSIQEKI